MQVQELKARTRSKIGKGHAGRARRGGRVPGVLYGGQGGPVAIDVDTREFSRVLHGRSGHHAIVQLTVEDAPDCSSPALLKAVQHHPARGEVLHADFQRIRLDERITTQVPLRLVGTPIGVTMGGVLDHQLRELEVECLALEVPEEVTLDVAALQIGDGLHVQNISVPGGVTILTAADRTVVSVHAPRLVAEKEAAPAEGEEGAEGEGEEKGEEKAAEDSPKGKA